MLYLVEAHPTIGHDISRWGPLHAGGGGGGKGRAGAVGKAGEGAFGE
jgi:hypothetical protein